MKANYSFDKRQREAQKKRRKEEKLLRKSQLKPASAADTAAAGQANPQGGPAERAPDTSEQPAE